MNLLAFKNTYMEVIPTKKQDIPLKIRSRMFLFKYFWPFLGVILTLVSFCVTYYYSNIHFAVTFGIFFIWFYLDFISPGAIFFRKFFKTTKKEDRLMNELSSSYLYINSGNYTFLSGMDYLEKIMNFLKEEFEKLLRLILHPVILVPYSIFTFQYYNHFSNYGDGSVFLYFSAVILLWYTNETFLMRKNQDIERMSKFKPPKFQDRKTINDSNNNV